MTKTIGITEEAHDMLIKKQKEIYNETKINFKLGDLTDLILRHNIDHFAVEQISVRDIKDFKIKNMNGY